MRIKNKRVLKNGTVAGYVYYPKEKKWKWRFLSGPSLKTGGKRKKKFKGKRVNTTKYFRPVAGNSPPVEMNNQHPTGNSQPVAGNSLPSSRRRFDEKIDDVRVTYIKLFGRKYVFLGEIHKPREGDDYRNYSDLIHLPIELSKVKRKCVDIYIEYNIVPSPILSNNRYQPLSLRNMIGTSNQKIDSLLELSLNLLDTDKHDYYSYRHCD